MIPPSSWLDTKMMNTVIFNHLKAAEIRPVFSSRVARRMHTQVCTSLLRDLVPHRKEAKFCGKITASCNTANNLQFNAF